MIKLKEIPNSVLDWYYYKMKDRIDLSSLSEKSRKFLSDETVKSLLIEKPIILLDIHNAATCELRDKAIIGNIFDYDSYISKSKSTSYEISKKIGINTCTYCNRNYTLTVVYKDKDTGKENDFTRITRPQFDHFFSQNDYPLLALSIYNLIPSCNICNSTIKGSKPLTLELNIHPYIEEEDFNLTNFKFSFEYDTLSGLSVKTICEKESKIEKTLDFFKIEDIYNAHSNYELKDLYDLRLKYSDTFLEIVEKNFGGIMSKEEAHRMIFGVEINEEDHHKRPFSKFKKDIIEELLRIR